MEKIRNQIIKNKKFIGNLLIIFFFSAAIAGSTGCLSYKTCVNGKCTTTTKEWENGRLKTTKCTNGKCVTTYSSDSKEKKSQNNNVSAAKTEEPDKPVFAYKPTANQKIFMKYMDDFDKSMRAMPGETTAMQQQRKQKFDKSIFKKASFRKVCLEDVEESCAFGGGCNTYNVSFYVPLTDNGACDNSREEGYRSPKIIKHNVCKGEALRYKPGKKYDVSGSIESYYLYSPDKDSPREKLNFIEKYFYGSDMKVEMDTSKYMRCIR